MSQPSALGHPALAAASERAFGKLLAAMPQRMQTQAASIRARLHIDPVGWHPSSGGLDLLPIVQDAIARDCKLSFLYSRADGESGVRTVDPFGIVAKQGIWYLVARAPAGMRTYRISRMQDAVVLAVTFERPANFDLAAHWKTATAQLQQKREQFRATLALAPDAAVVLRRWCRANPAPEVQQTAAIPDKWMILHVFFESQEEARFVALGFGCARSCSRTGHSARRGHGRDERSRGAASDRSVDATNPTNTSIINMTFRSGRFGQAGRIVLAEVGAQG